MRDSNNNDRESHKVRKIEKEKWLLLGLVAMVIGAIVLGAMAHSEGQVARGALEQIQRSLSDAVEQL
ncbi:hypothetical protein A15D_02366 [Alcanivorax sp. MD8A]|uniref:hypothetical protein n=1 Tax=Alcanivorax sp. MD8A TaxID=1177157 RepID=UPI000C9A7DB2|nr:hypothetical protein [Alcanivorax sp. MD8A]MED5433164.1 hypothetical protein [Pseudomonadota bacterium]PNE02048.1 hypothetical protein A15D_02366 [Alcanivorax sp. MD8A]